MLVKIYHFVVYTVHLSTIPKVQMHSNNIVHKSLLVLYRPIHHAFMHIFYETEN